LLGGYAVALAAAQVGTIAVSVLHVAISGAVALGIVTASSVVGTAYYLRLADPSRGVAVAPETARRSPSTLVLPVAIIGIAWSLYGLTWIAALNKPDFSFDGNTYHIPMIHLWARRGYIHWIQFDNDPGPMWDWDLHQIANGYPKGAETTSFLLVRLFGTSGPVNTCNLVFFPLGVAGVVVTARALGASSVSALMCGAALGLVPTVIAQGPTAYVDVALAHCIAALVGCLAVILGEMRRGRVPWPTWPAAGSVLGLTAASKSSGVAPVLFALGFIMLSASWVVARATLGNRTAVARTLAYFVMAIGAIATCVAGYWYVRNYVFTENPLSPVRVSIFGHTVFPGLPLSDCISESAVTPQFMKTWPSWRRIASTWLQGGPNIREFCQRGWDAWAASEGRWPMSIRYYDSREGGLGYLWAFACMPSIFFVSVWALRTRTSGHQARMPNPMVLFPVLLVVFASFTAVPMNWWSRYTTWIYAAGLPCLALVVDKLESVRQRLARVLLRGWLVACFGIACFEALYAFRYNVLARGFVARPWQIAWTPAGVWNALTTYEHPTYFFEGMSPMDIEVVTGGEPVALGELTVEAMPLLGQLSMPIGLRDIVFLSRATASDEEQLRGLLAQHRVRYVFWRDDDDAITDRELIATAR
jgi:hypothetical protein